jgi:Fe(II)/alpha-ketoglutarate-dependent arginine beta-hydroxylase
MYEPMTACTISGVKTFSLGEYELEELRTVLDDAQASYQTDDRFVDDATVLAHRLPAGLRATLNRWRLDEGDGAMVINGYSIDDNHLGPTPAHWKSQATNAEIERAQNYLLLSASLLGDPFAWATQQDGNLVHEVVPILGHEEEQLGSSSLALLTWHTEDAFHPLRPDFVVLICLRNPEAVATLVAEVGDLQLADWVVDELFEEQFLICPDESHQLHNRGATVDDLDIESYRRIEGMRQTPDPVAILFGDRAAPYVRADPYFMLEPEAPRAAEALQLFVDEVDRRLQRVALGPGDLLVIDNYRCMHGRQPFRAAFDGRDRWLRRVNVAGNIRASRHARQNALSRVIG